MARSLDRISQLICETEQFDIFASYLGENSKGESSYSRRYNCNNWKYHLIKTTGQLEHGRNSHQTGLHNGRKIYSMDVNNISTTRKKSKSLLPEDDHRCFSTFHMSPRSIKPKVWTLSTRPFKPKTDIAYLSNVDNEIRY